MSRSVAKPFLRQSRSTTIAEIRCKLSVLNLLLDDDNAQRALAISVLTDVDRFMGEVAKLGDYTDAAMERRQHQITA